jgi:hypothetical protein
MRRYYAERVGYDLSATGQMIFCPCHRDRDIQPIVARDRRGVNSMMNDER